MANHNIPSSRIDPLIKGPSPAKITQVSNLQNFIQDLFGEDYHTFLQGSYINRTAISDINDVDIVVVKKNTYSGTYSVHQPDRTVYWDTIFAEIEERLKGQDRYKWAMDRGDKCIKLTGSVNVDIVPAVQIVDDHLEDPIAISSFRNSAEKVSHPRIHITKGQQKHAATNDQFKPMVRMLKNWKKNHFGDNDLISSHKIEALVNAVPNNKFYTDPVANFILTTASMHKQLNSPNPTIHSVCGNEDIIHGWDETERALVKKQLLLSMASAQEAYEADTEEEAIAHWRRAFNA